MNFRLCLLALLILLMSCHKEKGSTPVCPPGYSGPDCNQMLWPSKVLVHSIVLTRFNYSNNGVPWDSADGPDIYVNIEYGNNVFYTSRNQTIHNAAFNTVYTITPPAPVELNPYYYYLTVIDSDPDYPGDIMQTLYLVPFTGNNGFPEQITLDTGGAVGLKLNLSYEW